MGGPGGQSGRVRPPCAFLSPAGFFPPTSAKDSEDDTSLLTASHPLSIALLLGQVPHVSPLSPSWPSSGILFPALPSLLHKASVSPHPRPTAGCIPQPGGATSILLRALDWRRGNPSKAGTQMTCPRADTTVLRKGNAATVPSPWAWWGRGWLGGASLTSAPWLPCSAESHGRGPPAAGLRRSAAICRSLVPTRAHCSPSPAHLHLGLGRAL